MFDKIEDLIKTDQESQEKFMVFKKEFKKIVRSRAIVLAIAFLISIAFLIYAANSKMKSDTKSQMLETKVEQLQAELEKCRN